MRDGRATVVARFLREWVLVASLPISVPLLMGWFLSNGRPLDAIPTSTVTSALSAYSIAISLAFIYEVNAKSLQNSSLMPIKTLGVIVDVGRLFFVIAPVALITLSSIIDIFPSVSEAVHADMVVLWAAILGVSAALIAITVAMIGDIERYQPEVV